VSAAAAEAPALSTANSNAVLGQNPRTNQFICSNDLDIRCAECVGTVGVPATISLENGERTANISPFLGVGAMARWVERHCGNWNCLRPRMQIEMIREPMLGSF